MKLTAICRKDVASLLRETGHVLSLEDVEQIETLNRYSQAVCDELETDNRWVRAQPRWLNGTPFYPLTIGKAQYLDSLECPDRLRNAVVLYVLTRSETPSEEPAKVAAAAQDFVRTLNLTPAQINAVLREYFPETEVEGETDYGAVIGLLCREYGEGPDYWIHKAGFDEIRALVTDWQNRQAAEYEANKAQAAKFGRRAIAPAWTPKLDAIKRYKGAVNELRASWQTSA